MHWTGLTTRLDITVQCRLQTACIRFTVSFRLHVLGSISPSDWLSSSRRLTNQNNPSPEFRASESLYETTRSSSDARATGGSCLRILCSFAQFCVLPARFQSKERLSAVYVQRHIQTLWQGQRCGLIWMYLVKGHFQAGWQTYHGFFSRVLVSGHVL